MFDVDPAEAERQVVSTQTKSDKKSILDELSRLLDEESRPASLELYSGMLRFQTPLSLRFETMPDNPNRIALFYGPILLAADLGTPEQPLVAQLGPHAHHENCICKQRNAIEIPVFVSQKRQADSWLRKIGDTPLVFEAEKVARPEKLKFIPFYLMHHRRYAVYIDLFSDDEWIKQEAEYKRQQLKLAKEERMTVDVLRIGEMQPERDHNLTGERTVAGEAFGRKWRDARDGGWFAFDMKVDPEKPLRLVCTYWGSDGGNRTFDILIDGDHIATQSLTKSHPDRFFDVKYAIPPGLTAGREKVTVRFQAHRGNSAGGVFGCRMTYLDEKE